MVQEARFPAGAIMDPAGLRGDSVFLVTQGTVAIVAAHHPDLQPTPRLRAPVQSSSSEEFCLEGDAAGNLKTGPYSTDLSWVRSGVGSSLDGK